ncbi:MAG: hypothetical protein D6679_12505 [Candidatus Hydrogenedentota bacterium]|nr:MAG: hypothetical protein D6679_12505 [Candidatus Hydrogenedentota bacterium]
MIRKRSIGTAPPIFQLHERGQTDRGRRICKLRNTKLALVIPSEAARSDSDEEFPEIVDNRFVLPHPSGERIGVRGEYWPPVRDAAQRGFLGANTPRNDNEAVS